MMVDIFDLEEHEFLVNRDNVSDAELAERVRNVPDMGGSILVELSEFIEHKVIRDQAVAA